MDPEFENITEDKFRERALVGWEYARILLMELQEHSYAYVSDIGWTPAISKLETQLRYMKRYDKDFERWHKLVINLNRDEFSWGFFRKHEGIIDVKYALEKIVRENEGGDTHIV